MRRALIAAFAIAVAAVAIVIADEGWVIDRMHVTFDVRPDGTAATVEEIDVDFRGLERHGIYREIRYLLGFDETRNREYEIDLQHVTSADGRRHQVDESTQGDLRRFRIGDPDRTISGKETYRIAYRLAGALNAFADHDEFYWNVTGDTWPVTLSRVSVTVRVPRDAIERTECFQGYAGSAERCTSRVTAAEATFSSTRPLLEGEQLTVVVSLRKGAVASPAPRLVRKPRGVLEFFEWTPAVAASTFGGLALVVGGLGTLWWRVGRDRHYVSVQSLSADKAEQRLPLHGGHPVAVEFEPPDGMRPAEMGLLLDERADTLDVTATIIDLAVRGYLKITELPKAWFFSSKDWQLDSLKAADASLLDYERIVLNGLFDTATSRKLSDLKKKFYDDLARAKTALYADAVARQWFPRSPETVRTICRVSGLALAAAGVFATIQMGRWWGASFAGLPLIAAGVLLALSSRAMPRRTAAGREAMRRALGFVRYIRTAETSQQAFAERAHIFTAYLPYAVAFKCVDRWARAFEDIDMQAATAGFYTGSSGFDVGRFSSTMGSFSSSVSSTITSTPGGSGGSGFSGGSSGGGGGGGGGGSW